jgi:hypothetical protein
MERKREREKGNHESDTRASRALLPRPPTSSGDCTPQARSRRWTETEPSSRTDKSRARYRYRYRYRWPPPPRLPSRTRRCLRRYLRAALPRARTWVAVSSRGLVRSSARACSGVRRRSRRRRAGRRLRRRAAAPGTVPVEREREGARQAQKPPSLEDE